VHFYFLLLHERVLAPAHLKKGRAVCSVNVASHFRCFNTRKIMAKEAVAPRTKLLVVVAIALLRRFG
jgi:hypothetical protein